MNISTDTNTDGQAVLIRHAYKHYGPKKNRNQIFNDLNMTVKKGSIYGLLGSSGCGKTTLLSVIVGRKTLQSGEVWVLGGKPGQRESGVPGKMVGYMPQELALYGDFSIKETMAYFGWIFGMKSADVSEKLDFITEFLSLPPKDRLIKNLSGGQQRRVSFACALIHDPDLLILDEPTVGVDPLLRQKIWDHLVNISKKSEKTIIITTHYIEEAKQSNTIGLMRNGKLLAEATPAKLIEIVGGHSLEEVFLKLSRKQDDEKLDDTSKSNQMRKSDAIYASKSSKLRVGKLKNCCNLTTAGKQRALINKNFLKLWRNINVLLFLFGLPMLQVILFCMAVGREPTGLKLAIVNREQKYISRDEQSCKIEKGCSPANISCRYLDELQGSKIKTYYPNLESAKNAVKDGKAWGVIYFDKNYSGAVMERALLGKDVKKDTLGKSEIKVYLDMSSQQIGITNEKDLLEAYQTFMKKFALDCKEFKTVAETPIKFMDPIVGEENPSFLDYCAPGMIVIIAFFLAVGITAVDLIVDRVEGLLDRSWVAGVSPFEVIMAHVIIKSIVVIIQSAIVLIFILGVFQLECRGSIILVLTLTILQGMSGMSFGFFISAICRSERNAIQFAVGAYFPFLMLSGSIWPIEGMDEWLRIIALCLPLTKPILSLRAIMSRNYNFLKAEVFLGYVTSFIWIGIFLVSTLIILKFKQN